MDINYFFNLLSRKYTIKIGTKEDTLEVLDFSTSYALPYCKQFEEGSDSQINKGYKTIDVEYTKIITKL